MKVETDSWSEYWQAGQKTTFGSLADFRENAHLAKLWRDLLGQSLKGKVLDIGCGNGALSLLLVQLAQEQQIDIDVYAIDSAKIQQSDENRANVHFYAETSAEEMPFADQYFDSAVSHFGFEYTDVDTSLISTHRVLNPGATLTLVSHHRSSWLSRESFDILRQLIGIEESGLINTLSSLLGRLDILQSRSLDPSKDQEAEKLREALNRTAKGLQDKTSTTAFDPTFTLQVISAALRVFKEEHRAGKSRSEYVNLLQDSLRSHAARLQAHKNAALSDEEWTMFKVKIEAAGFEVGRFEPVVLNGYHYGHLVQAVRR